MNENTRTGPQAIVVAHPLLRDRLTRLRDATAGPGEFRRLLAEVGLLLAARALDDLPLAAVRVTTPIGSAAGEVLAEPLPCVVSILRAGNGLLDGFRQLLPEAPVGMIGMARDEKTLEARRYYCKLPAGLDERLVIVVDPMLATGHSATAALEVLKKAGAKRLRLISVLAAPEGIAELATHHPDVPVYTAAIDDHLDHRGYIVPGLGDAGDRLYGTVE